MHLIFSVGLFHKKILTTKISQIMVVYSKFCICIWCLHWVKWGTVYIISIDFVLKSVLSIKNDRKFFFTVPCISHFYMLFSYITVVLFADIFINGNTGSIPDWCDVANYIHVDLSLKYAFVTYSVATATKVVTTIKVATSTDQAISVYYWEEES